MTCDGQLPAFQNNIFTIYAFSDQYGVAIFSAFIIYVAWITAKSPGTLMIAAGKEQAKRTIARKINVIFMFFSSLN